MSEKTKVTAADMTKGTESAPEKNEKVKEPVVLYATREECEANEPNKAKEANAKKEGTWKPLSVTRPEKLGGEVVWLWSVGHVNAAATVAGLDGYIVSSGTRQPRKSVDKGAVAMDVFSHYTETQLKELGLPTPVIESILRSRKEQAEKTTALNKAAAAAPKPAAKK